MEPQDYLRKIAQELGEDLEGDDWLHDQIGQIMQHWKTESLSKLPQILTNTENAVREMKSIVSKMHHEEDAAKFLQLLTRLNDEIDEKLFGRNFDGFKNCVYVHMNDDLEGDIKRLRKHLKELK